MKFFILICIIVTCNGTIRPKGNVKKLGQGKIVGGSDIKIGDAPYQLQLEVDNWQLCGASIIADFFALTSAKCVDGYNQRQLTLRAGSDRRNYGGRQYQVYRINIHPKYDDYFMDYDIAVLEVATPFRMDDTTKVATLATTEPDAGTIVKATGWGRTAEEGSDSNQLKEVDIPIIPRENCTFAYAGDVTVRMICAGEEGQDACYGDRGGPLVDSSGIQVGVSSWSYGCARDGYPGIYTNIANLEIQSFIQDVVGELK